MHHLYSVDFRDKFVQWDDTATTTTFGDKLQLQRTYSLQHTLSQKIFVELMAESNEQIKAYSANGTVQLNIVHFNEYLCKYKLQKQVDYKDLRCVMQSHQPIIEHQTWETWTLSSKSCNIHAHYLWLIKIY